MSILAVVKGCPLFYELYDGEILKIVEKCDVLNLVEGDYVFRQEDVGNEIFLILNGTASVKKDTHVLARLRRGDLFGEMVLLKENIRKADIFIETHADILVISYNDIFNLYENNNKIFSILMLNLARMLATRLKKAGKAIESCKIEIEELKKS